jgi:hypothetical protein
MANRTMNINTNINNEFILNEDQRMMINIYINQYNHIFRHINHLYTQLDDIRNNIHSIINFHNEPRIQRNFLNTYRMRQSRSRFNNHNIFNNLFGSDRNNQFLFYDYDNPINPNTYIQPTENSNSNSNINPNSNILNLLNSFLNTNVIIRPTQQQINNASSIIRFGSIQTPSNESCPISLENFQPNDLVRQIHHCGHIFSQNSFNQWFQINVRCPVCRYDIREYNNNTITSNSTEDDTILDNVDIEEEKYNPNNSNNSNLTELTNNILSSFTDNIVENLFRNIPLNRNNNSQQLFYDPSNNLLIYETLYRPQI